MGAIQDLTAKVDAMTVTIDKVKVESTAAKTLIEELKAMQADQTITPEFAAKIDALAERINSVDEVFTDAEPAPVDPPVET